MRNRGVPGFKTRSLNGAPSANPYLKSANPKFEIGYATETQNLKRMAFPPKPELEICNRAVHHQILNPGA